MHKPDKESGAFESNRGEYSGQLKTFVFEELFKEAGMMCKFEHENVLGLLGISLDKLLR